MQVVSNRWIWNTAKNITLSQIMKALNCHFSFKLKSSSRLRKGHLLHMKITLLWNFSWLEWHFRMLLLWLPSAWSGPKKGTWAVEILHKSAFQWSHDKYRKCSNTSWYTEGELESGAVLTLKTRPLLPQMLWKEERIITVTLPLGKQWDAVFPAVGMCCTPI